MDFSFPARLARPGLALLLWGLCASALAVELGEPVVRSYRGQPLVADFELTNLAGEQPVQVRLAHPEVYNGANIKMHPVLSSATMSVMRRDGRQFLHFTTIRPVESEYVHVFFELVEGGKPFVRGATLWFTADPNPAPPPPPPPPPAAVRPADKAPVYLTDDEDAPAAKPAARVRQGARAGAAPLACPPAQTAKACQAIDYKNGVLTAQIVELEEKVRLLQTMIEGKPPAASAAASGAASLAASAAAIAAVPKGPPPKLGAPAKAKPKVEAAPFPWLWIGIGAGVLALLGGGGWFLWRRKKAKGAAPAEPQPGMLARLKARFAKKGEGEVPKEEPSAD